MMKSLKLTALLIVLLGALLANAQDIKTKISLDSSIILIGDQVKLKLEVEYPSNIKIFLPVPADSIGNTIEVVERLKVDSTKLENNRLKLTQEFVITSFDSGMHFIPAFPVVVTNGGIKDTVLSNAAILSVYTIPKLDSLINALKGPIDIKAPYEAPITLKEVAPWILGILLLAGLIFLIVYYFKHRQSDRPLFSFPQKPKEPAHVIALRKLDQIKEEKIWQQGKTKQYYSEVTDALREYIENRFGINAMEQTSEETISSFKLKKDLIDEAIFNNLKRILTNADLVKFAKFEPLPDDNNLVLVDAFFFVNQTKIEEMKEANVSADEQDGNDVMIK